ncbi:ImmA/IrrE family metallo-endopeptidase [Parahaliea maris]|uniref:ImmA/IrrE family metallo-endopeptidase n=1 Tax=Parahaliea maris TaxID=2716870 RepID=A0A5C8ZNY1_9GAMM|nr:XRE family transcriptional regulator [Parahaliea maris]TXS89071.1 ImmA/IrrE family metallo-endopeptidase [Parahaliea maris]
MPRRANNPKSAGFNPSMLQWAREWRGISVDEIAAKLNKPPAMILDWESPEGDFEPTVNQARKMAELYQRPFLEFFLPEPPSVYRPKLVPDFRLYQGAPDPTENRDFIDIQGWAESLRINALDLYEEIGEAPPEFPKELRASIKSDPEEYAALAREWTKFTLDEQLGMRPSEWYLLPDIVRRHIESLGVIVAKSGGLKAHQARGLCLFEQLLPVIVYTQEYPGAQAFTLAHELAHLMVGESGIIGPYVRKGGGAAQSIEDWCDNFAGAYLMPKSAVMDSMAWATGQLHEISDDALEAVARTYCVSPHAALVRLVKLGKVDPKFYWNKKREEFLKAEDEYKSFARPKYYATRYKNKVGEAYTGLVLEAWKLGRISNHNAAEYLGIKKLQYLNDISAGFGA